MVLTNPSKRQNEFVLTSVSNRFCIYCINICFLVICLHLNSLFGGSNMQTFKNRYCENDTGMVSSRLLKQEFVTSCALPVKPVGMRKILTTKTTMTDHRSEFVLLNSMWLTLVSAPYTVLWPEEIHLNYIYICPIQYNDSFECQNQMQNFFLFLARHCKRPISLYSGPINLWVVSIWTESSIETAAHETEHL